MTKGANNHDKTIRSNAYGDDNSAFLLFQRGNLRG